MTNWKHLHCIIIYGRRKKQQNRCKIEFKDDEKVMKQDSLDKETKVVDADKKRKQWLPNHERLPCTDDHFEAKAWGQMKEAWF